LVASGKSTDPGAEYCREDSVLHGYSQSKSMV
jgi:hypothetical protein